MKRATLALLSATILLTVMFVVMFALMPSLTQAPASTVSTIAATSDIEGSSSVSNTESAYNVSKASMTEAIAPKIETAKQAPIAQLSKDNIAYGTMELSAVTPTDRVAGSITNYGEMIYATTKVPAPDFMMTPSSDAAGAAWASNTMYGYEFSKADLAVATGAVSIDVETVGMEVSGDVSYATGAAQAKNSATFTMTGSKDARPSAGMYAVIIGYHVAPASAPLYT